MPLKVGYMELVGMAKGWKKKVRKPRATMAATRKTSQLSGMKVIG